MAGISNLSSNEHVDAATLSQSAEVAGHTGTQESSLPREKTTAEQQTHQKQLQHSGQGTRAKLLNFYNSEVKDHLTLANISKVSGTVAAGAYAFSALAATSMVPTVAGVATAPAAVVEGGAAATAAAIGGVASAISFVTGAMASKADGNEISDEAMHQKMQSTPGAFPEDSSSEHDLAASSPKSEAESKETTAPAKAA